tara:strand:+ start:8008 stop:8610 length:603 start_codon:yes stop_codon:yes gene_type:complete
MTQAKVIRHKLIDRIFHWLFAIFIFVLLASGLLPVFGVNFSLIVIHWISGLVLTALLLVHICRSVFWKSISRIWFSRDDLPITNSKSGKYSLAQKLMHQFIACLTLAAIVTGLVMMVRIDTPFWERDPYWLSSASWGFIYFIHGLVALCFISAIMLHIYFSLRPESRMYLRSMFKGWITEAEFATKHDEKLWQPESKQDK